MVKAWSSGGSPKMSLRRSQPIAFHPRGISDTLESSQAFPGAMMSLRDLIPDPSTRGLWQCRPASIKLGDTAATGGAYSSGFSNGFSFLATLIPLPIGVISCLLVVGDMAYGMVGAGGTQDYPFAFNLKTKTFNTVTGIVAGGGGNLPAQQLTSGDWTPPTMDVVGPTVLVTHPGFAGS